MQKTTEPVPVCGNLPDVIANADSLYEGDLVVYFQAIFKTAQNLRYPYHNFRHMLHVVYMCYLACVFYREIMTKREIRNLLIAALFHDFDHSGMMGNDDLNIERAIRGLRRNIQPEDLDEIENIIELIRTTEYPPKFDYGRLKLSLSCQILCDADLSQALAVAWIQQVIFGLSAEWGKTPYEVLGMQKGFLSGLSFMTEWAQELFPPSSIAEKIAETEGLLQLLTIERKLA